MANNHWSQTALDVKVFGVNAFATIPLLCYALRPSSISVLVIFFITLIFFIVVENHFKLRACYVPSAIRYFLMGSVRSPKSVDLDF